MIDGSLFLSMRKKLTLTGLLERVAVKSFSIDWLVLAFTATLQRLIIRLSVIGRSVPTCASWTARAAAGSPNIGISSPSEKADRHIREQTHLTFLGFSDIEVQALILIWHWKRIGTFWKIFGLSWNIPTHWRETFRGIKLLYTVAWCTSWLIYCFFNPNTLCHNFFHRSVTLQPSLEPTFAIDHCLLYKDTGWRTQAWIHFHKFHRECFWVLRLLCSHDSMSSGACVAQLCDHLIWHITGFYIPMYFMGWIVNVSFPVPTDVILNENPSKRARVLLNVDSPQ